MREPTNYNYWLQVLKNDKQVEEFMKKGSKRQIKELKQAKKYKKLLDKG